MDAIALSSCDIFNDILNLYLALTIANIPKSIKMINKIELEFIIEKEQVYNLSNNK